MSFNGNWLLVKSSRQKICKVIISHFPPNMTYCLLLPDSARTQVESHLDSNGASKGTLLTIKPATPVLMVYCVCVCARAF